MVDAARRPDVVGGDRHKGIKWLQGAASPYVAPIGSADLSGGAASSAGSVSVPVAGAARPSYTKPFQFGLNYGL